MRRPHSRIRAAHTVGRSVRDDSRNLSRPAAAAALARPSSARSPCDLGTLDLATAVAGVAGGGRERPRRMADPAGSGYGSGMKLKGTIRRNDLEGGVWTLETEKGDTYQLTGSLDGAKDGMRAEVEGKVDKDAMGFAMVGPQFAVQKLTSL